MWVTPKWRFKKTRRSARNSHSLWSVHHGGRLGVSCRVEPDPTSWWGEGDYVFHIAASTKYSLVPQGRIQCPNVLASQPSVVLFRVTQVLCSADQTDPLRHSHLLLRHKLTSLTSIWWWHKGRTVLIWARCNTDLGGKGEPKSSGDVFDSYHIYWLFTACASQAGKRMMWLREKEMCANQFKCTPRRQYCL